MVALLVFAPSLNFLLLADLPIFEDFLIGSFKVSVAIPAGAEALSGDHFRPERTLGKRIFLTLDLGVDAALLALLHLYTVLLLASLYAGSRGDALPLLALLELFD